MSVRGLWRRIFGGRERAYDWSVIQHVRRSATALPNEWNMNGPELGGMNS